MIIEITRGHIKLAIDQKTVTVEGEALLASYGGLDFVVYSDSIHHWDSPNANEAIDVAMKLRIIEEVVADFQNRGMKVEIE